MTNAAMLWSGGKDSAMALYEAGQRGYRIACLVTFAPPRPDFLAHPLTIMRMQAAALALPHHVMSVVAPFDSGYEAALSRLRDEMDIRAVVTGDIAEVDGRPNWIRERSRPVGLEVVTPLWGRDRPIVLRQFIDRGFRACFSCVHTHWLDECWIGRELSEAAVAGLTATRARSGLDLCGEEGEYHTMVIDGPPFTRGIEIPSYTVSRAGALAYMDIRSGQAPAGIPR
jgi:uncharacterized protein (TIGR00290 family)